MSLFVPRSTHLAVIATLGFSLFAAACSPVIFPDVDAQVPPGTAALTVVRTGIGTVSSNPGGITCGATCSAAFPLDAVVTLTATPDTGAEFAGWSSGGCSGTTPTCMVTVAAATTVTELGSSHPCDSMVYAKRGPCGWSVPRAFTLI
jgi:hypothetical protein